MRSFKPTAKVLTVATLAWYLVLAGFALFAYTVRPRCQCVIGRNYVDPVDPADCEVHGRTEP